MRALAADRGGEFLSEEYLGSQKKHRWRCDATHEWEAVPGSIRQGSWCPECVGVRKKTLADMHALAAIKGGRFLSVKYAGMNQKHRWSCSDGHEWDAVPSSIRLGTWCPECAGQKPKTLMEMRDLAASRGGEFLSPEYLGTAKDHQWRCDAGHEWKASINNVQRGTWCPFCCGKLGNDIKTINALAVRHGGVCLSPVYLGMEQPHEWQCASSHRWRTKPSHIKAGSWCPMCSKGGASVGERISREVLELLFLHPFPKRRPEWLGVGHKGLELDGFAESIGVAFEYHGRQHYEAIAAFGGEEKFSAQQERDSEKSRLCYENGVRLVVIPEFTDRNNLSGCIDQIEYAVIVAGLKIPKKWKRPTDLLAVREPLSRIFGSSRVAELHAAAQTKGGELLPCDVVGSNDPLRWRCSAGHEFEKRAPDVLSGRWCPQCSARPGTVPKTLADMHDLAASLGGEFISLEYTGWYKKYSWRCKVGHEWEAPMSTARWGKWCLKCREVEPKPSCAAAAPG